MQTLVFIAISICILGKARTISAEKCYFPDGSESTRDTPCSAQSGQASACCAYSDVCLDNSLCLSQEGAEVVSRGTCTDRSWQSSQCPQFCQDVKTNWGINIYTIREPVSFCCGPGNSTSSLCTKSTRGSFSPFPVQAGRVIFNRTSGSTSPNSSDTTTVTVSSIATSLSIATALSEATVCPSPPSPSEKPTAVGLGVGIPFGVAFLGTLGLLWRQRTQELGAKKEARSWQERYDELKKEKYDEMNGAQDRLHELENEGWRLDELDGRLVYEAAGRMG